MIKYGHEIRSELRQDYLSWSEPVGEWMKMNKKVIYFFTLVSLIGLLSFFFFFVDYVSYKNLDEIMDVHPENVTRITLSNYTGDYRTTTDPDKIEEFVRHLKRLQYKRLSNDQTSYMPMLANIIYLTDGVNEDFIVPYGQEAMISYKVYQMKGGSIDQTYILDFYNSLDN